MEQGLAAHVTNTYGDGSGNTTTHYYAGAKITPKKKGAKMACKKKPGKK